MRYSTVLFDLDGTLLNTLDDLAASVNYALRVHQLPERSLVEVRRFLGNGIRNLMVQAAPEGLPVSEFEAVLATFKAYYMEHSLDWTSPYAGIPTMLQALRRQGIALGIVSNKVDAAVGDLHSRFFASTMDYAIGERVGMRRKPAPDMLIAAMQDLDASPERTLYVGDSEVDFATARAAGVDCALVLWGFRDAPELKALEADYYVASPDEIVGLLGE